MSNEFLRRYTDIPALTYLLTKKKITLLDPKFWDDSNDSHYLSLYKQKNKLKSLLALCFTEADETYHHWRVFAGGTGGVCICFDRTVLLDAFVKHPGIRFDKVRYTTLLDLRGKKPMSKDLPFIKRYAFQPEDEFRVIYESKIEEHLKIDITIPLTSITRITLSPWAHKSLATPMKALLKSIEGCEDLEIVRSTMVDNREWKNIGQNVA